MDIVAEKLDGQWVHERQLQAESAGPELRVTVDGMKVAGAMIEVQDLNTVQVTFVRGGRFGDTADILRFTDEEPFAIANSMVETLLAIAKQEVPR